VKSAAQNYTQRNKMVNELFLLIGSGQTQTYLYMFTSTLTNHKRCFWVSQSEDLSGVLKVCPQSALRHTHMSIMDMV